MDIPSKQSNEQLLTENYSNDKTPNLPSEHPSWESVRNANDTINTQMQDRLYKIPNSDYISQSLVDHYMGSKQRLSAEEIRMLLRDSRDSILRQYNDHLDISNSPSFSKLKSPYPLICRERYRLAKKMYEHQLQSEIQQIINQQPNAFDAICFVRVMAITSLWPPLHTHRNVDHTHQNYFQLTGKQRSRLNYIMGVDWSKT